MAGPNDLSVSLTIDTTLFQKNLDEAVKSLNDFSDQVRKAGNDVQSAVNNMGGSTQSLKDVFESLGSTLATIGLGAFIKDVVEGGVQMSQLAASTGMSTESMMELTRASSSVGKDVGNLTTVLGFLEKSAENAVEGNIRLRADFEALGITMNDLKSKNMSEVVDKIAHSLAAMEDPAKRAQIAYELMSRQMKGVDWKAFAEGLDQSRGKTDNAARGAEAAQAAFQAFSLFMTDLKNQILALLAPFLNLAANLITMADKMGIAKLAGDALLGVFIGLSALGVAKIFGVIVQAVEALALGMGGLLVEFAPIIAGFAAIAATAATAYAIYQKVTGQTATVGEGFTKLGNTLSSTVSEAWGKLTGMVNGNTDAVKKNKDALSLVSPNTPTADPNAGALQSLKNQYAVMEQNNKLARDRLALEISLVGASDTVKAAAMADFENQSKYKTTILNLDGQIAKLEVEQANKRGVDHSGEIEQLKKMKDLASQQRQEFQNQLPELVKKKEVEDENLRVLNAQEKATANIQEYQRQADEASMSSNEKKIYELQKWGDKQIEIYAKVRQIALGAGGDLASDPLFQQFKASIEGMVTSQQEALKKSQGVVADWLTGWKGAVAEYAQTANDKGSEAKKLFNDSVKGMEDAIVEFAKTGKLSFQNLLATIAEDILRSNIKSLFNSLFNIGGEGGGGGGGIFSAIGSLLGFADGGVIPTNQPVLVGEKGPEIISGAAGMTVTPNSALNNGQAATNITYNINAVDALSFKQMIAADPTFIYAISQQGAKSLPNRNI
jgi:lambda family phage tail tape measure protein